MAHEAIITLLNLQLLGLLLVSCLGDSTPSDVSLFNNIDENRNGQLDQHEIRGVRVPV